MYGPTIALMPMSIVDTDTLCNDPMRQNVEGGRQEGLRSAPSCRRLSLFQLNACACIRQLLLHLLGVIFGCAFLDGLRSAVHEVFRFFQTEARQFAYDLDDVDL